MTELFPSPDEIRVRVAVPVAAVMLLEDRARVTRRGAVSLVAGLNRLTIQDVSPVLQDVSLRATAGQARVVDTRARRAARVRRSDRPEEIARLEAEIEVRADELSSLERAFERALERRGRVQRALENAAVELPEDAAWGLVQREVWQTTIESLMKRARRASAEAVEATQAHRRAVEALRTLLSRHQTLVRVDADFVAWVEVDVLAENAGECSLEIEYVVANALWRPTHAARLSESKLEVTSSAVVWQNTGEDWTDAELTFSTSRTSLGTDPPNLSDDLLSARKRADRVVVAAREVEVQRSVAGAAPSGALDLPGVDDGGEVRTLSAEGRTTIVANGRPVFVPLFRFEASASVELLLLGELDRNVICRVSSKVAAASPLLEGPVELVRDHGPIGFTKAPFTPPGGELVLGFGPDEDLRAVRRTKTAQEPDPIDGWKVRVNLVQLFLSNLGPKPKRVEVIERIAVSEVAEVEVEILEDKSTAGFSFDTPNGFVKWTIELPPYGKKEVRLCSAIATAPKVAAI
ncbi:MAG: mucoidy inhibitor MuiA family protein [Deltaproteobacteria bacterium]|nr:mucoidy inhibitor MuiA family protein [Deltaproteobacteria bacterium]